ncbi:DNA polymerase III subunit beta [Stomatohabitans albus]|uniref:DNA polymerase III subunit beta n=1 Tax=Stomatohabitans albus TaxID=3110766 RepID=UPI00300D5356
MQFRIERDSFEEAIKWIYRTVGERSSLPALAGIKLTLSGDVLVLTSTDGNMSSEVTLQVQGQRDGSALVQGKLLRDVASRLPSDAVNVSVDSDRLEIVCARAKYTLRMMQIEDFPQIPTPTEQAGQVILNAKAFSDTVGQVIKAVSSEDVRVALTGVRIELADGVLTGAATDSYRLSVRSIAVNSPDEMAALVTKKAMDQAKSAADALGGEVTMVLTPTHAVFQFSDRRLVTTLLEGKYPAYRQLIPTNAQRHLRIDRAALANVVKRVSVIGEAERTMTPVIFDVQEDTVHVAADSSESGRANESLSAVLSGEPIRIAFNPRFLLEGLDVIHDDMVDFAFNDDLKPAVIRPAKLVDGEEEDKTVTESLYLLMPVRT